MTPNALLTVKERSYSDPPIQIFFFNFFLFKIKDAVIFAPPVLLLWITSVNYDEEAQYQARLWKNEWQKVQQERCRFQMPLEWLWNLRMRRGYCLWSELYFLQVIGRNNQGAEWPRSFHGAKLEAMAQNEAPPPPTDQTAALDAMSTKMKELEERLEERTNRQLRKILVFRNVPEVEEDKKWSTTKALLASKISQVLDDVDENEAMQMIDRCHRGGKKPSDGEERPSRPRPIYAAMLYWEDCERLTREARSSSVGFYIDYKYGPRTTVRRNEALKKR